MNNLRRWGIIFLFTAFNINISYQMFMFQSINSLVANFYNIDENLALMLGQISLILLAIVLLPYAFLSDFVSVRNVVITSSMMVAIGSTLKTLASMPLDVSRNLFPLLFIGQVISQVPRAIALPYASQLANLMLPTDKIARAVAWSTSGFTLGLGLGYIVPAATITNQHAILSPIVDVQKNTSTSVDLSDNSVKVQDENTFDFHLMNKEMFWLNLTTTILSLIIFVGLYLLYKIEPDPINLAERKRSEVLLWIKNRSDQFKEFLTAYKSIFQNIYFVFLLISFMCIHGTLFGFFLISRKTLGITLDGDVNFKIGILMMSMFFGFFCGSNLAGVLIDRLGKLKIIGTCAISVAVVAFVGFEYVVIIEFPFWVTILTGAIFVTFLGMTIPIYFNLGGELVYPVGEAHATTFFTAGMNVFGLLIIELIKLIDSKSTANDPDTNNGLLWTRDTNQSDLQN